MRFAALVVAGLWLAACGARGSQGPAWPKAAERETDGGESIAPRESKAVAVADDEDAEATAGVAPTAAASEATPGAAAATATTPTTTTPTITVSEDAITVEEIVIEISDDDD